MESLAAAEPYTRSFEARIEEGGTDVVLSETYFYPEGGGQPADRGTVDGVSVVDVRTREGTVVHVLEEPVEAGRTVPCTVDAAFRTYCMRAHTASHVLYGAGRRLFDGLGYGGFGITAEDEDGGVGGKVRVDLETASPVGDEELVALERLANRAVWDSRPVTWESLDRQEALSDDGVAFNTKTEEGLSGTETVRIVDIEGWDRAACGGTHVRNTREIGPVTVLSRSNPGEGQTRIEFAVGPTAIERRAAERRELLAAARTLDTSTTDLGGGIDRLQARQAELESRVEELQERYVSARIDALSEETFEREGVEWLVGELSGLDTGALADQSRALAGAVTDVVVLVSPDGSLAVGTTGRVDAGDIVDAVTDEFGGGGGGSPTAAQAGGFEADADSLVSFLKRKQ